MTNKKPAILKSQHFLVKNDIYPFDILVSINETAEKVKRTLKRFQIKPEDCDFIKEFTTQKAATYRLPANQVVIRFKTVPNKHEFMAIVAHEALHATSFILNKVGIPFDQENSEEAYTYLMQHICYVIYQKTIK